MRKINLIDMMSIFGGAAEVDCMKEVQDKANGHETLPDPDQEDAFWEKWADEFEDCAGWN